MKSIILILLLGVTFALPFLKKEAVVCNDSDRKIFQTVGHKFKSLFRTFAGFWVTQADYEVKIQQAIGLSPTCSQCYGKAYRCGWDSCKLSCYKESPSCDQCLLDYHCTTECDECTGFFSK